MSPNPQDPQEQLENLFLYKEKINQFVSSYKLPLIFGSLGLALFFLAVILLIKTQISSSQVVFTTESSPSAKTKIRIDIEGAILSPGVYELLEGSRIADALTVAGGLSADADREWVVKYLNRAAKLVDGGKIYIPSTDETVSGKVQNDLSPLSNPSNLLGVTAGKVNINTASQADLEALPGIGPVTAGKIIAGRPYQTVEELKTKKITGSALFEKLKDLLIVF